MTIRTVGFCLVASIGLAFPASAQWPDGGMLVCGSALDERGARCLADGLGHFWVGWGGSSPVDTTKGLTRITRRNEAGQLADGWSSCGIALGDTSRVSTDFSLAGDGATGVYVAWTERRGQAARILCQHLDAAGTTVAGWPAGGLVLADSSVGPRAPRAISDETGGVYVCWYEAGYPPDNNTASTVRGVRLSSGGALQPGWVAGGKILVLNALLGWAVDPDGTGGLFVSLGRNNAANTRRVALSRYQPDGALAPGWTGQGNFVANAGGHQDRFALVPDGTGGAYVRWYDAGLHLQRMSPDGGPASGWPAAGIIPATGVTDDGALAADGAGGVYLAYARFVSGANDLFLQRLGPDPVIANGWPVSGFQVTFDGDAENSIVAGSDGSGGLYMAWSTGYSIKAHRRLQNGTFPAGWASGGTTVGSGIDGSAFPRVVPSSAGALVSWASPSVREDRDSRVAMVDGNGHAGSTVGVGGPGAEPRIALEASPNPATQGTQFTFELPGMSDAELTVCDVAGRIVWRDAAARLPPGTYRRTWRGTDLAGRSAPKGVYFARLRTHWGDTRLRVVRF